MFKKTTNLKRNYGKVSQNGLIRKTQILFVFLCMTTLYFSCSSEEENVEITNPEQSVIIKDGILKFGSIEDYENMLEGDLLSSEHLNNSLQSYTGFNSLQKVIHKRNEILSKTSEIAEDKFLEEDAPILNILNKDGMLTIGKWTLSIDLNHGIVGVTDTFDKEVINALKGKDFTNSNIRWFGTEDDVLSLLEDNAESTLNTVVLFARIKGDDISKNYQSKLSNECNFGQYLDSSTNFLKDKKIIISEALCGPGLDCERWLADAKHVYQKAGIYFSLQSKIKYRGKVGCSDNDPRPVNTRLTVKVDYSYERRVRFRKKNKKSSGSKNDSTFSNELNIRSYNGSRSLKKYKLNTTFTYERKDPCVTNSYCSTSNPVVTIVMPQINN